VRTIYRPGIVSTPNWQGKVLQALLKEDQIVHFTEQAKWEKFSFFLLKKLKE
jgi:hypothetical protein